MAWNAEHADWPDYAPRARAGRPWRWWHALFGGLDDPLGALVRARSRLFLWMPIALGLGAGAYFSMPVEPRTGSYGLAAALGLSGAGLWARAPLAARFPAAILALAALGFLLAGLRAHLVAAPVLGYRYYGLVEGRIVQIDRSSSDRLRLTLDRLRLERLPQDRWPERVRVTMHGDQEQLQPVPGMRVTMRAHLSPPPPPAAPDGYDFRRAAWFDRLGAVGYVRRPVAQQAAPDRSDWTLNAHRARMRLSRAIQSRIAGQPGAIAAALLTGDRSGLTEATREAMRSSNLAHLIAISGLHMGLLTGFVFALVRSALAAAGRPALIWPAKKIAALCALLAATAYLWLAGPAVSTQRAWIMVSVMLAAVLVDRRALSLRTVALAASLLLIWQPESLTEPGFQMSFAATTALIVALGPWTRLSRRLSPLLRPVLMLVATSLIAGLATAPIVAAHFHRISEYGLVANLLAVPAMGLVVMPMGVVAALLAPLGLAGPALWAMGIGTGWILAVAERIAALEGAVPGIAQPGPLVLPLLALGALGMVLARGAGRSLGAMMIGAAGFLWVDAARARPALLIAPEAQQVGLLTPSGRVLSKEGAGFIAGRWLEADGDAAPLAQAAARAGFSGPGNARAGIFRDAPLTHLSGKGATDRLLETCIRGGIVILAARAPAMDGPCEVWDQRRLRKAGAVAFDAQGQVTTTVQTKGRRLWTKP